MQDHVFIFDMPTTVEKYIYSPTKAAHLFSYHELEEDDIMLLIRMKEYLKT